MIKTVTYLGKYTKLYMWHKITEEIQSITWKITTAALLVIAESCLRPRSHYAGEIWKRSFISTVRPTLHTNRHENRAFRKRSSNRRNLKTPALRFRVEGKHFENGAFRKRWTHDNHVIPLHEIPGYSPTVPILPAQRGRDFGTPDLERGIHFRDFSLNGV